MSKFTCLLLCVVCFSRCNTPASPGSDALRVKAEEDSLIAGAKEALNFLTDSGRTDQAIQYLDQFRQKAAQKDSRRLIQQYWYQKGYVYLKADRLDSAEASYERARQLAAERTDEGREKDLWAANEGLANTWGHQGKYNQAFQLTRAYYAHKKERNDTARIDYVAYKLGILASQMGNQEMRKKYLLEALSSSPQTKGLITAVAAELQGYYMELEKFDSADHYFNTYIVPDTIMRSPIDLAAKEEGKGLILVRKDSFALALQYFQAALRLQAVENGIGLSQCYVNAAKASATLGKLDLSLQYADSAVLAARKEAESGVTTNQLLLVQALELKAKTLKKAGRHAAAFDVLYDSFSEYKQYTDSSYAREVKTLEEQYAGREKDQAIATLAKEKETALRLNKQQRIITAGTIVLFAVLGLLGILYYRRSKLRDKFRQIDLEQRFLHSQMEPHFLFNVLSILQRFIRSGQTEKSINYLNSFAKLLRTNLESSRKTYVPLEDEISVVKSYLNMQSMGQDSNFDYSIDVFDDEERDAIFIYPMIIQPFVENALQHGIKNLDYRGRVHINICKHSDYLECIIDDNGVGLPDAGTVRNADTSKASLAIQITKERLALLSRKTKKNFRLLLQNKQDAGQGRGTVVSIQIPYQYG